MTRPSAVVISPEAPFPVQGGGALRTASLLYYLAARYDLDLILFRQAGDSDPALSLPPGFARNVSTITLPFHSRRMVAWMLRNGRRWIRSTPPLLNRFSGHSGEIVRLLGTRRYDLGVIEHFWCAPYVDPLARVCTQTVLDLHNVESALHASCAVSEPWPMRIAHRRFEQAYLRQEQRWLPRFSRILATSPADAERIMGLCGECAPVTVYRNSLPTVSLPQIAEDDAIGFSGNFEYHPNYTAVRFFLSRIWPQLLSQFPSLKFRLIGKNPGAVARFTQGVRNVEITGPIEDAVGELARLKVAVVPLLSGSGTRLKIIEAWAAGRPVISTAIGAEGLNASHGVNILMADHPDDFARSVAELLGSEERRRRIGCAARQTYEEHFTWETAWRSLAGHLP